MPQGITAFLGKSQGVTNFGIVAAQEDQVDEFFDEYLKGEMKDVGDADDDDEDEDDDDEDDDGEDAAGEDDEISGDEENEGWICISKLIKIKPVALLSGRLMFGMQHFPMKAGTSEESEAGVFCDADVDEDEVVKEASGKKDIRWIPFAKTWAA